MCIVVVVEVDGVVVVCVFGKSEKRSCTITDSSRPDQLPAGFHSGRIVRSLKALVVKKNYLNQEDIC